MNLGSQARSGIRYYGLGLLFFVAFFFGFGLLGYAGSYIIYLGANENLVAISVLVLSSAMLLALRDYFFGRKRRGAKVERDKNGIAFKKAA